jgi:hypothetical protein
MGGKHTGTVSYDTLQPRAVRRGELTRDPHPEHLMTQYRKHVRRLRRSSVLGLIIR